MANRNFEVVKTRYKVFVAARDAYMQTYSFTNAERLQTAFRDYGLAVRSYRDDMNKWWLPPNKLLLPFYEEVYNEAALAGYATLVLHHHGHPPRQPNQ